MSASNPYSVSPVEYQPTDSIKAEIRPFDLIGQGWEFIRQDYWLFLGLAIVTVLISSLVPFGIVMGPMMVGLWLCHLERESGRKTTFETLFKGFDHFMPSFLAFLIHMAFIVMVMMVMGLLLLACILGCAALIGAQGEEPNPAVVLPVIFGGIVFIGIPFMVISMCMHYAMFISFLLIADRNYPAWESVVTAYGAVFKNFWGLLLYFLVTAMISLGLLLLCYFPIFFFMPVMYASLFCLYRQLFPSLPIAT